MSEATVLVQSVELKEGVSQKTGKPYRRVVLTDGNGKESSAFDVGMYEVAKPFEGKQALVDTMPNGKFFDLLSVKAPPEDPKDKLGTGEYVKGKAAPADKRGYDAYHGLELAIASFEDFPLAASANDVYKVVAPLADLYFVWLQRKSGFQLDDQDIPF